MKGNLKWYGLRIICGTMTLWPVANNHNQKKKYNQLISLALYRFDKVVWGVNGR